MGCSHWVVSGGTFTEWLMVALGVLVIAMSFARSLKLGGARSSKTRIAASPIHRIIWFIVGVSSAVTGLKLIFLCR
jgi:hypothetical protein